MARVTTFRAGHVEGERPAAHSHLMAAHSAGSKVLLGDISEFQPDINDTAYLAWSKAIVIRAMYGANHVDRAWRGGARRDALHAGGARFVASYQYVVASQDPITQAAALVEMLGSLRQGEVVIGDFEEGSGSMAQTRRLWSSTIAGATGDAPWDYSGLSFAADHGLQPVKWLAAYQSAEPSTPHTLWQFTDRFTIPGVGHADCSVFHGTIDQLAAMAHQAKPKPAPHPGTRSWKSLGHLTLHDLAAQHLHEPVHQVLAATLARNGGTFPPSVASHVEAVFAEDTGHCPAGITWKFPGGKWLTRGQLPLSALAADEMHAPVRQVIAMTAASGFTATVASYIDSVFARSVLKPAAGTIFSY